MGCGGSKGQQAAEADQYQQRKRNDFKDPGLEKHRKDCVRQKKKLRHVEDPDKARKKKKSRIKEEERKQKAATGGTGGGGGGGGGGPLGITENQLQATRNNLKHHS